MKRRNLITGIIILIAFGAGAGIGVLGFLASTGGLTEESTDVGNIAPTLSLDGPTATPHEAARFSTQIAEFDNKLDTISTQVADTSGQIDGLGTIVASAELQAATTQAPLDSTVETPEPIPEEVAAPIPERALYRISGDDSQVRFMIDEVLLNNPFTVIATTRRVAGDVIVNFSDPAASQAGTIAINARSFRTDNEFRDQSIRSQILETNEHEFIEFVPTELVNLPSEPVGVGSTVEFQIVGDLTIKNVTHPVTFDTTVAITSEDLIEGLATATVLYKDFNLTIQPPPNVGAISDEVTLEIDFVAPKVDED